MSGPRTEAGRRMALDQAENAHYFCDYPEAAFEQRILAIEAEAALAATPAAEPGLLSEHPEWSDDERAAATALLDFINPTTDPDEIERRRLQWAAFEQGRKFEHRWCATPAAEPGLDRQIACPTLCATCGEHVGLDDAPALALDGDDWETIALLLHRVPTWFPELREKVAAIQKVMPPPTHDALRATAHGTIESVTETSVVERLDAGAVILYAHLATIAVERGQQVEPGDVIGYYDRTHLPHFEVHQP